MTDPDLARALRRRWTTGVAIVTTTAPDGALTIGSLMMLSQDPPTLAFALARESSFHALLAEGTVIALAILDREGEFLADRFAGRAPVPDARFGGIPHTMIEIAGAAIPVLTGRAVLAWTTCHVTNVLAAGDHTLVLASLLTGALGDDTDDPLLYYEGHYRGLEVAR